MTSRVVFSTVPLIPTVRTRLQSSTQSAYEIIDSGSLSPSFGSDVEILLLGEARWLDKFKIGIMPELRMIQAFYAGVDSLDFEIIPERVLVCGNVGAYSEQVAEHVFGMILSLAKNLYVKRKELANGTFDERISGIFLKDKMIGIVGAGGIGQAVARIARAFGMKTFGINSSGRQVESFDEVGNLESLNEVLTRSDVLVFALPLTTKTVNILNESNIDLTKENCILINVGRGAVINEKALFDRLRAHPSFRAGTDVWWKYPSSRGESFAQHFPFFDLENFIGTPHIADALPESHDLALSSAVENIIRYLNREPLKGLANREDYVGLRSLTRGI